MRIGSLLAEGEMILMADADGATTFNEFFKLREILIQISKQNQGHGMVIGSRYHLNANNNRNLFRSLIAIIYNRIITFIINI